MNDSTVQVTKRCSKCGEEKPANAENFYRRRAGAPELQAECAACMRARWAKGEALRKERRGSARPREWRDTTPERLWSRINKDGPVVDIELGPCWIWTGYTDHMGYGQIGRSRPRRVEAAHRVAWELVNGPIPEGLCVLHKCDNPPCCNPGHHFLGTRPDNMADKVSKCRQPRGSASWNARLTEATVIEALRLRATGASMAAIARHIGATPGAVKQALRGKTWAHVTQSTPELAEALATAQRVRGYGRKCP